MEKRVLNTNWVRRIVCDIATELLACRLLLLLLLVLLVLVLICLLLVVVLFSPL